MFFSTFFMGELQGYCKFQHKFGQFGTTIYLKGKRGKLLVFFRTFYLAKFLSVLSAGVVPKSLALKLYKKYQGDQDPKYPEKVQ